MPAGQWQSILVDRENESVTFCRSNRAGLMAIDFEHVISANEYGFYCVPAEYGGRELPKVLARGAVYEPATLSFLCRHVGKGDIVTGGAFVGDFFPALRRAMAPSAKIHSFEPAPLSHAAASETIRLNGLRNVVLSPVAVGEKPDTLPLQLTRKSGAAVAAGVALKPGLGLDDERVVPVEVVTLDSLVASSRKVTLVHLDVEGFEEPALRGAARILTDNAPIVVLEAGKPWKQRRFQAVLDALAPRARYRFCGEIERNAIFRPDPA